MSDTSQCLEFMFCQLRRQCAEIPKYAVSAEREAGVARIANRELVWPGWEEKGAGDQPGQDESGKSSRASGGSCGGLTQACTWSLGLNLGMHRGGNCRHRHV